VETARELLRDTGTAPATAAEIICPVCRSSQVGVMRTGKTLSILSCLFLLAGLILDGGVPASRTGDYRCKACGHRWKRQC